MLDQKGDDDDVDAMRHLAVAAGVPFVMFDSQDPDTDRWQPLWGTPDKVAARCVEPIKQSEPYYYDVLRRHLDIVCRGAPRRRSLARRRCRFSSTHANRAGTRRSSRSQNSSIGNTKEIDPAREGARKVGQLTRKGTRGSLRRRLFRLEVALALASRQLVDTAVDPQRRGGRCTTGGGDTPTRGRHVAHACKDTMPDEAAALSVLALADLHDAAEQAGAPWTLLLDEFGAAVIKMAAQRGVAILQRGRSHGESGRCHHAIGLETSKR